MSPRHLWILLGGLASLAAIAAGLVVVTGGPGTTPAPAGPYVALGDSYTAGPRVPDQTGTPAGCLRSGRNYPALVAGRLGLTGTQFRDVSCSGATTDDLTAAQSTDDGVNPPQFDALTGDTRLVTIGIGGNDIGYGTLLEQCVAAGVGYFLTGSGRFLPGTDAPCRIRYTADGQDQVAQRIRTAGEHLATALAEIHRRSPQARVYVVGYPAILPATSTDCPRAMPLAPGDMTFLRDKQDQLNTELRERAADAGAGYVDTATPSAGHDVCSGADTRWIEPLIDPVGALPVHPNARGEQGMASALLRTLDR